MQEFFQKFARILFRERSWGLVTIIFLCFGILTSIFLFLISSLLLTVNTSSGAEVSEIAQFSQEKREVSHNIEPQVFIDVSGAVKFPGVYRLPESARLSDAVKMAGSFHPRADYSYIAQKLNLAKKISDGEKIFIPFQGEGLLSTPLHSQDSSQVSINSGTKKQLDEVPGLGEKTVEAIIENRPYTSLDELVSKAHISESLFKKISDQLTL